MPRKKKRLGEDSNVAGFFRIHIVDPDGTLKGDSGWVKNVVTNAGHQYWLMDNMLTSLSSARSMVDYIGLGTGAAPASNATGALSGEASQRVSIGANTATTLRGSSTTSSTIACYATFSSSIMTAASTIQNIGLFYAANTATTAGSCFPGTSYSTSAWATNQNVNVTYEIRFTG